MRCPVVAVHEQEAIATQHEFAFVNAMCQQNVAQRFFSDCFRSVDAIHGANADLTKPAFERAGTSCVAYGT